LPNEWNKGLTGLNSGCNGIKVEMFVTEELTREGMLSLGFDNIWRIRFDNGPAIELSKVHWRRA